MDNPEKLTTLATQDTGRRQTKQKQNTEKMSKIYKTQSTKLNKINIIIITQPQNVPPAIISCNNDKHIPRIKILSYLATKINIKNMLKKKTKMKKFAL